MHIPARAAAPQMTGPEGQAPVRAVLLQAVLLQAALASSSSSSASDGPGYPARAPAEEPLAPEPPELEALRGRLLQSTFVWKGFKFTQVRNKAGEHSGWEATCYVYACRRACRRTLGFGRRGNPEVIERRLKWWCLQAWEFATCEQHQEHGKSFPQQPPEGPPSLAELEAIEVPAPLG